MRQYKFLFLYVSVSMFSSTGSCILKQMCSLSIKCRLLLVFPWVVTNCGGGGWSEGDGGGCRGLLFRGWLEVFGCKEGRKT